MMKWCVCAYAVLVALVAFDAGVAVAGDDVASFYKGRNVTIDIGYSAGGGYDIYARVLARHLGDHIPGNPTVIPQNMPGAGSLKAVNYLYNLAPKDGTVIATFARGLAMQPILDKQGIEFDAQKLNWIGSITNEVSVCAFRTDSGIATWQDMLTMPVVMGGQYAAADSDIYAHLYNNVFGAKIKLVSGYPGTNDITLAMLRGEVDGICGLSWGTIKVAHPEWIKEKSVNLLLQAALEKAPDLPDVPLALDLINDPEKKQILFVHFAPQAMARPFAAPPGIPQDRKQALIKAFDETMKDPELIAEADKEKMDLAPMTGSAIDGLLRQLYAIPKDVTAKAAKAIE